MNERSIQAQSKSVNKLKDDEMNIIFVMKQFV